MKEIGKRIGIMIGLLIVLGLIILAASGCDLIEQSLGSDEGYWKITFTADVSVYGDGSIPTDNTGGPVACFASGYIGAVLYFPFDGGEVVAQESFVTMEDVSCIECSSEIVSNSEEIPIELMAVLDLNASKLVTESGEEFLYEDFRVWMEDPLIYPVDINYTCPTGIPGISSDYGGYTSQLISPFLTQVWSFSPTFGEVDTSTFTNFEFPPTYSSDITFSIFEEYAKEIK